MSKEELQELKRKKELEIEDIDKQLNDINTREFLNANNYIGKYYCLNNSNSYLHVKGYNHNTGVLYGTEIYFSMESVEKFDGEYNLENEKYTEISEKDMMNMIKECINTLVKEFKN